MTTRRLFSRVQPASVIRMALSCGMGADERVWGSRVYGSECRDFGALAALVLSLESPGYVASIRSQPYTWDFEADAPRAHTPLKWMLTVIEQRADGTRRLTNLSVYDVGDPLEYEAVLSEGDPAYVWHYNYWRIERQHCDQVMSAIERYEDKQEERKQAMSNPFKSRKFVYAVTSVIMFLVVAYLPAVVAELGLSLPGDTQQQINNMLPWVLVLGFALIGGHSLQDAISLWTGYQPNENLKDAILAILDELLGDDDTVPPTEVNIVGATQ